MRLRSSSSSFHTMNILWHNFRITLLIPFVVLSIAGCVSPLVDEQLDAISEWNIGNAKAIAKISTEQHTLVSEISNAISHKSFEARRSAALADIHQATFDRFQRCRLEVANQCARQGRTEREERDAKLDTEEQKRLRGVGDIAEEIKILREQARSESRQISSRDLLQQVVDQRSLCIRNAHIQRIQKLEYPDAHCSVSASRSMVGCSSPPLIPHADSGRAVIEKALHALRTCLHDSTMCDDLRELRGDVVDMTRTLVSLSIERDYRDALGRSMLMRDAIVKKHTGLHALHVAALNDLAGSSCMGSGKDEERGQYPIGVAACPQTGPDDMLCASKPKEEYKND